VGREENGRITMGEDGWAGRMDGSGADRLDPEGGVPKEGSEMGNGDLWMKGQRPIARPGEAGCDM